MTLLESILICMAFMCIAACSMIYDKEIEDLRYQIDLIKGVNLEFANVTDTNFEIIEREIEEAKGPVYGPMLEDDE